MRIKPPFQDQGIKLLDGDPLLPMRAMSKFVVGQLGQSLDGRIATRSGDSKYINHKQGLKHLHRLRSIVDAVVVGVGTVNDDDPLLSVRLCEGKSPVRVIIDPRGRVFKSAQLFHDDGSKVIILTDKNLTHPMADHADIVGLELHDNKLCPIEMIAALEAHGYGKLLIEGGNRTLSTFVDKGCLDRLHLIVAPLLIGSGYPGLNLATISKLDAAKKPDVSLYHLGHDVLFDCDLRAGDESVD
ncbi:MAG: RibD family protein [Hyphomicrobiales bacterium]